MSELNHTTAYAVDNGCFHDGLIIDVSGQQFDLMEIGSVKAVGWIPQWMFFLDSKVEVDLDFVYSCSHSLDDFKVFFLKMIYRDLDFWESAWDFDELSELVNKANTIQDILNLI
ncbi:MAG: hypothetical protein KC646_00180 [Candidatus Cloacimonetes bacterium]|nr:hypothetical protein [Candidatus Cloacimonadota bacterium]